jgi:cytochrome c-type biogenesis protein CcmH
MIFVAMLVLALVLMTPLALAFFIAGRRAMAGRREAALGLHRAQLVELERDAADGRIGAAEYKAARLEVERRLLAADAFTEPALDGNARLLLIGTAVMIPVMAFVLYLPGSTPNVPSEPHAAWVAHQEEVNSRLIGVITALRMRLASEDPNSLDASQGEAYLAEALSEQAGTITPEALSYFQQSLANAPAGASWRALDEERIGQAQAAARQ